MKISAVCDERSLAVTPLTAPIRAMSGSIARYPGVAARPARSTSVESRRRSRKTTEDTRSRKSRSPPGANDALSASELPPPRRRRIPAGLVDKQALLELQDPIERLDALLAVVPKTSGGD